MPELDGLEATRRFRLRCPAGSGPRVIAMTANAMKEDMEACLAAGMDDYVSKPIAVDRLVAALNRCQPRAKAAEQPPAADAPAPAEAASAALEMGALNQLLQLVDGQQALLVQLIDSFLDSTPSLLKTMHEGLGSSDVEPLRRAAHTLKSSARDFGAVKLSELCRQLESDCKAGRLDGAPPLERQILAEYEAAKTELEKIKKRDAL